jgi:hypothetical protein
MRTLVALAASSVAALGAFRTHYSYDSLYPLRDGLIIGSVIIAFVLSSERWLKRRVPAWLVVAIPAGLTAGLYWTWLLLLMM